MGHRANFVLIRDGEAHAYHDQWAALGCTYAFAAGPELASRSAETSERTDELLEADFAEAGYLIDHDERVAFVFGYPEFDPDGGDLYELPREEAAAVRRINAALMAGPLAFLEHIAPQWTGWRLTWDERGVDAFADYLHGRYIDSVATQPASAESDRPAYPFQA